MSALLDPARPAYSAERAAAFSNPINSTVSWRFPVHLALVFGPERPRLQFDGHERRS